MVDTSAASWLDAEVVKRLGSVSTATLTMALIKKGVRTSWLRGPAPLETIARRVVGPGLHDTFCTGTGGSLHARTATRARHPFAMQSRRRRAGSVVVIDGCGNPLGATLGDILVARLARKGVVAAVTDAPVRDADEVRAVGLPVLSAGVAAPPSIVGLAFAGFGEIIGCGGVAIRPGDVMVCDNDGAVVVPIELAAAVAEAGMEQERYERFVQQRVKAGDSVFGLYPPGDAALAAYGRWIEAGEPGGG